VSHPSSRPRLRGLALICLAAVSWGTTGSVSTILAAQAAASPLVVGAARLLIAAVFLLVGARCLAGSLRIDPGERWRCLALGACMAAYQVTYFSAVAMTGIAAAALIAICCAPLIIAGLAAAMLGERVTARVAAALIVGVTGTALLIVGPRTTADVSPRFVAGALLALGASFSYALYVVVAKASLARTAPLPLAAANFSVAAVLLLPLLAGSDAWRQIVLGWPWLLYLGAVATAGAYAIYTIGLRAVPASVAGIASLLEPLTATLLGVGLFGERLGVAGVLGALLLFTALGLLAPRDGRTTGEGVGLVS
jgi:DME family drug/metabolite transporter